MRLVLLRELSGPAPDSAGWSLRPITFRAAILSDGGFEKGVEIVMHQKILVAVISASILLASCNHDNDHGRTASEQDQKGQTRLCQVSDVTSLFGEKLACEPGQKVAFLPDRFGNEQIPILFAAKFCDIRYGVVSNPGGVVCIYQPVAPIKTGKDKEPEGEK
jgi:hypothetical protein